MDNENCKRKAAAATLSPGNTCRGNKAKKTDCPEATGSNRVSCNSKSQTAPRGSDLTQKLVAMWLSGTQGNHPFMTQEIQERMALREAQEKCTEAENLAQKLRIKITNAEAVMNDLSTSLKAEERSKGELLSKMNLTGDLAATVMEHINYLTDTLQRSQQHKDHLNNLYNNIILKQRESYDCLINHKKKLENRISVQETTISTLEKSFEKSRNSYEEKSNQVERAYEAEMKKVRDEYDMMRKQLEQVNKEKKIAQSILTDKESNVLDLEKKIAEYEILVNSGKEQMAKSSANLEAITDENTKLKSELDVKNQQILKIFEELETATSENTKQATEISIMKGKNVELEEQIKCHVQQRQSLAKSLESASVRSEQLEQQLEKLKGEKEEAVKEIKMKIESAEKESILLMEAKKELKELESKKDDLLKFHVERYESCLAEMKLLEARHQSELSRVSTLSTSSVDNLATENRRLEEIVVSLKREKNDLQVEVKQIEDLLMKHANSEKHLRLMVDEHRAEAAKNAAALEKAQLEKKLEEAEKHEKINKIKELEKKLLNLQFNQSNLPLPLALPSLPASEKTKATAPTKDAADIKATGRTRRSQASSTYKQKSILKHHPKPRKTRSTPPSPVVAVAPPAPVSSERKITFNFDSSSEGSPVKLQQSAAINAFMGGGGGGGGDLFDNLIGTGRSSSQPMQSSQTLNSQRQPTTRKFFKNRNSQPK